MGFAAGFTGGVALTLAVAYLSTAAQRTAREEQSLLLQHQADTLDAAIDHPAEARRPTRAELAAARRANFVDRAKDRWNADVESTVRWLQGADWSATREKAERRAEALAESSGAYEAARRAKAAALARTVEVREEVGDIMERSLRKGKDIVNEVETAVGSVAGVTDEKLKPESDVAKALRQRFEKAPAKPKTVAEVLAERLAKAMSAKDKDCLGRIQRAIVRHYNEERSTPENQGTPRDSAHNEARDNAYFADMSRLRTIRGRLERQAKRQERREAVGRALRGVADTMKDGGMGRAARWVKDALKDHQAPVSSLSEGSLLGRGSGGARDDAPVDKDPSKKGNSGDKGKLKKRDGGGKAKSKKERAEDKQKSKEAKAERKKQRKAEDERWRESIRELELKTYGPARPPRPPPLGMY
ncbi:uncharacterized protein DNG_09403 [Cephalotrichum gorgonifer]|uniref:MICOS complex subunit MIC12 n=1 Tax=Cephalotrichum gorgonifer TaxID=2041049 RepID=A0AAE8N783_9PEZI|nr:uncharacterized protein DNG_09403 [Cephalotrichum gorgonifer]